uniref:3-ketoacyl-CoA thiolase 1 peroxisomal-like n=1 Tax=Rhizophora mucronata TaxID=61149 RepID=A0A2P2M9Z5_RHIMU
MRFNCSLVLFLPCNAIAVCNILRSYSHRKKAIASM